MIDAKEYYKAWIGSRGIGAAITVMENADMIVVSVSLSSRVFMATMGLIFFAGLILSLTKDLSFYIYLINGLLALLSLFVFFNATLWNKTLVFDKYRRHILLKSGSTTKRILKYDSIKDINLIPFTEVSESLPTRTYRNWYMVFQFENETIGAIMFNQEKNAYSVWGKIKAELKLN